MTDVRFPFLKLPNDLGLKVMKTMSLHEQIAFSLASKKSYSRMKSLSMPISRVQIKLMGWTVITLTSKDECAITFKLKSQRSDGFMTRLEDIPVNLDVLKGTFPFSTRNRAFTVSTQGRNLREWIPHFCSMFQCENYEAHFTIGMPQLDIQLLRNILPKLRSINLGSRDGRNEQSILYAQRILRTFLPDAEIVRLFYVPLNENLSLQHIAAANLKKLRFYGYSNLKLDDFLSLNVECCHINTDKIALRDLNRFFKLWKKGSNPKLKLFLFIVRTENKPDWNIFLKGLQGEGAEETEVGVKSFMIRNSVGVRARIRIRDDGIRVAVEFVVSNFKEEM